MYTVKFNLQQSCPRFFLALKCAGCPVVFIPYTPSKSGFVPMAYKGCHAKNMKTLQ